MLKVLSWVAAIAVAVVIVSLLYIGLTVWSVGWINHDGTITVTIPENQQ